MDADRLDWPLPSRPARSNAELVCRTQAENGAGVARTGAGGELKLVFTDKQQGCAGAPDSASVVSFSDGVHALCANLVG